MAQALSSARSVFRLAPVVALLLSLVAVSIPARPAEAQAPNGWQLCNQTSFVLEAATGRPEGDEVIVQGWTRLRPGQCRIAIRGPLRKGIYFVYARSSSAHRGGQRVWPGDIPLCVDSSGAFTIQNPSSCAAVGLQPRSFKAVRIDKSRGSMTFKETDLYNKAGQSAQAAGLQRLLDDAGIESQAVDGYIGRQSRAAIADFLARRKLPPNMPDGELIDLLENEARTRSLEVGLMLCNRTESRVVAAIARRRPDGWESRGWWALEAGKCVRTIDESLISTPHYVHAELYSPEGVRELKNAETLFCTARSKFAILGREDCEKRLYHKAGFAETAIPEDGKLVFEMFERSFGAPIRSLD